MFFMLGPFYKIKLILMRHTETTWGYGQEDHTRQLTTKGKRQALDLGVWLSAQRYAPTQALVSDATRTQQTLNPEALNQKCPVLKSKNLYLAEPQKHNSGNSESRDRLSTPVLAHNPGLAKTT